MSLLEEAAQKLPATSDKPIKLTIFFYHSDDYTHEEFYRLWTDEHGPLLAKIFARHGILGYKQFHTPKVDPYKTMAENLANGPYHLGAGDFDGAAELILPNTTCMQNVVKDPEYVEKVIPAELKFASRDKKGVVMFGFEEPFVENGKVVAR